MRTNVIILIIITLGLFTSGCSRKTQNDISQSFRNILSPDVIFNSNDDRKDLYKK